LQLGPGGRRRGGTGGGKRRRGRRNLSIYKCGTIWYKTKEKGMWA